MRKIILTALLFLTAFISFSQKEEENGKIYIRHSYIDDVTRSMKAYVGKDMTALATVFADTAKIWYSSMEKPVSLEFALKDWTSDHDFYDSIKVTAVGYPDYLHYKDKDQKIVQSWWTWIGRSKKTGEIVKVDFVQFDIFNSAGKIDSEAIYGDFTKVIKN